MQHKVIPYDKYKYNGTNFIQKKFWSVEMLKIYLKLYV